MKKLAATVGAAVLGLSLAVVVGARSIDVSGSMSTQQLLNNWAAIKDNLLAGANDFPSSGEVKKDAVVTAGTAGNFSTSYSFSIWDDFIQQTLTEADGPWIENSGASGTDAAINAQELGVVRLVAGTASGGDTDGLSGTTNTSQLVAHIPMQGDSDNLFFEARLHINTAVTQTVLLAGLTDSTSLEIPFEIGASNAETVTATNAALLVYDTRADDANWWAIGVNGGASAVTNSATGVTPVADTYQTLRVEVDPSAEARFYIDGTLYRTVADAVVTTTNLYATILATGLTSASNSIAERQIDIDYINAGHDR